MPLLPLRAGPGRALPRAPPGPYRQPGECCREAPLDLFEHRFGCPSTLWDLRSKVPAGSDRTGARRAGRTVAYATGVRSGPELRELSAEQFTAELNALAGIYAQAMGAPAEELPGRMSIMQRHAGYPAFRAVVALLP